MLNSQTTGRAEKCSNTVEALALPPVPDSFYTLTLLSLGKKPVPPSTYHKHGTQFVLSTHPLWKRYCHLLSVARVQKSQGKARIGPAWARCPAYTHQLWMWSVMEEYDLQAGTPWCDWGKNQFLGRCNKLYYVSYIHRHNFYQVTYHTLVLIHPGSV